MHFMKLLDQAKTKIKFKHYSPHTENTYVYWIKKYIPYHHKRHQKDMGQFEIEQFLSHLASNRKISQIGHLNYRLINEYISLKANAEDNCKGH